MNEPFKKVRGPLVAILAVIVILFALETFQRVKDYIKWRKLSKTPYAIRFETWSGVPVSERGGSLVLKHHPYLIYTFKESQQRPEATINAQGFRGDDWMKPDSASCRIMILGGSATFGQGASGDEQVFVAALGRLLNQSADRRVEVWNAGVTGYDSAQELVLITTVLLDYDPDLFIILDGWNDFHNSSVQPQGREQAISGTFSNFDEILSRNTQRGLNVFRTSSFFRWAEQRVRGAMSGSEQPRKFYNYSDNLAVYLPEYKKNLARMAKTARAHDVEVIIAPQPELFQRKGQIPETEGALRVKFSKGRQKGYAEVAREQYPAFIRAARDVAAAEAVTFVDASRAFDDFGGSAFVDFVHFGDEGHERLAHYLLPTVSGVLNDRVPDSACHLRPEQS